MTLDKLTPGMTVYDVRRRKVWNSRRSTVETVRVRIMGVCQFDGTVRASYAGQPEGFYGKRRWSKWRLARPLLITIRPGIERLATREEIKQAKLKNTTTP